MTTPQIRIETTPNPATLKFQFSSPISTKSQDFPDAQTAQRSPLATKLFGFPWTSAVYIGADFVTVTKQDWVDWEVLAEPLAGLIREHIEGGEAVEAMEAPSSSDESADDSPLVRKIKQALDAEIRPAVAMDGGDVKFAKFEEGILYLSLHGACSGCPSSTATLKQGIEVRLQELFPEIKEVLSY
ncbi:MAG: NifU family protein [Bdellovibrio sp. CG10_big_fil_rev_8_21_14_0_10_47_8]|nr:MAG: NifU family protein [Bdellovibrio sp. CG10_big_fil_rev_8_21_14_0_10_47_8]